MSLPNGPLISMATDAASSPPTSSPSAPSSMRTPRSNSHPSISSKFVIKEPHCFIRLRRQIYSSGTVLDHHDATKTSQTTMLQQPPTLSTRCTVTCCGIGPLYSCQILPSPPPFSIPVMMSACDPPTRGWSHSPDLIQSKPGKSCTSLGVDAMIHVRRHRWPPHKLS
jgi:hypothetical protein